MSQRRRWHRRLAALATLLCVQAFAQTPPPAPPQPAEPPANSAMDDRLFYQLLLGELALTMGDAGTAYEWLLDAARRTKDEGLFRRSVDIALQARAGDQALTASRAWRLARPESLDALRTQLQILMALGRTEQVTEPLRSLLEQTPAAERGGLISALPRFLQRAPDKREVATLMEDVLAPYRAGDDTRIATRVALGRAWAEAKEPDRALALTREAYALEPAAVGPALLAMELMRERPTAEELLRSYLAQPKAENAVRLAYVRTLTAAQRYADAITQLEAAVKAEPDAAPR
jgi:tetratricopeptide (TPR) repeat protein